MKLVRTISPRRLVENTTPKIPTEQLRNIWIFSLIGILATSLPTVAEQLQTYKSQPVITAYADFNSESGLTSEPAEGKAGSKQWYLEATDVPL